MSKQALQKAAYQSSGVTYEESLLAQKLEPCIYERIGREAGFEQLSQDFYDRVFADKDAAWFLNIFSSSTKQEAVENQVRSCFNIVTKREMVARVVRRDSLCLLL